MADKKNIEQGLGFSPKFDSNGLITAIAQDAQSGQILMVAYMNPEALEITIRTGRATYFSRSRKKLWKKGEESGHTQKIENILVAGKAFSANHESMATVRMQPDLENLGGIAALAAVQALDEGVLPRGINLKKLQKKKKMLLRRAKLLI